MKPGEEGKPEEGHRINIEIEVEAAPGDEPKEPKRIIPLWAWVVVLCFSCTVFLFSDIGYDDAPVLFTISLFGLYLSLFFLMRWAFRKRRA